ncbi:peptide ABC transporter substrate-binding protein [Lacticaseibacillus thailandensis]|nr:peptide ABC transporter substrate-binding protein [Lacticaseibacillus thailandensis]
MKKQRIFTGMAVLTAVTLLAACGHKRQQQAKSHQQTVNRMVRDVLTSMDPAQAPDNVSMQTLTDTMAGLYRYHGNRLQPDMAAHRATVSADHKTYTFHLRRNARWSDGHPVTASDFVYAWRRAVNPATKSEYAYVFSGIKNADAIMTGAAQPNQLGVTARDEHTLQVTLDHVIPYFEPLMTLNVFDPIEASAVRKAGAGFGTTSHHLTFNGPYRLERWTNASNSWTEVKNSDYWNAQRVHVKKIHVQVVKDTATAVNLFQAGKLDDAIIAGDTASQMVNDQAYNAVKLQRSYFLEMNQQQVPALRNQKVRQALSLAINRHQYLQKVLSDGSTRINTVVPVGLFTNSQTGADFATSSGRAVRQYTAYDRQQAQRLMRTGLKEVGINRFSFTLTADDTDAGKNTLEYLQGVWSKTFPQVTVRAKSVPAKTRLDLGRKHNFDVLLATWGADFPDAITYLDLFTSHNANNDGQWSNPTYDRLIAASKTTDVTSVSRRWQDLTQANQILTRDMGIIPLYQAGEAHLTRSSIRGLHYSPNNLIDFVGVTNK